MSLAYARVLPMSRRGGAGIAYSRTDVLDSGYRVAPAEVYGDGRPENVRQFRLRPR